MFLSTTTSYRFEIIKGRDGQYYFHFKAPNGQIVAQSEGYTSKQNCQYGIDCVKRHADIANVTDKT